MLPIVVCVGSSCYVRGSECLADTFDSLIRQRGLGARVEVTGAFCMDQCSMGISVRVGDRVYRGVEPQNALSFFEHEVMPCLQDPARA
jgi:NADH:ubiquinone oxidoreductase subunit E